MGKYDTGLDAGFSNVTLSGAADLDRVLKMLPKKLGKKALNSAVMAAGEIVRKEIVAHTPVRKSSGMKKVYKKNSTRRGPGYLKKQIIKKRNTRFAGIVIVGASLDGFYGRLFETGSRHQPARPFIAPAFEAKKNAAVDMIGKKLGDNIDKAAARLAGSFAKSGLKVRRRK